MSSLNDEELRILVTEVITSNRRVREHSIIRSIFRFDSDRSEDKVRAAKNLSLAVAVLLSNGLSGNQIKTIVNETLKVNE